MAGPSKKRVAAGAAIAVGGASLLAAPIAVPVVLSTIGFTSSGIAAETWAAGFMASYGGTVAAGSACAIMQSIAAVGTFAGAGATAVSGAVLSTSGVVLAGGGPPLLNGVKSVGCTVGNIAVAGVKSVPRAVGLLRFSRL